jgi:hypothetical protein
MLVLVSVLKSAISSDFGMKKLPAWPFGMSPPSSASAYNHRRTRTPSAKERVAPTNEDCQRRRNCHTPNYGIAAAAVAGFSYAI